MSRKSSLVPPSEIWYYLIFFFFVEPVALTLKILQSAVCTVLRLAVQPVRLSAAQSNRQAFKDDFDQTSSLWISVVALRLLLFCFKKIRFSFLCISLWYFVNVFFFFLRFLEILCSCYVVLKLLFLCYFSGIDISMLFLGCYFYTWNKIWLMNLLESSRYYLSLPPDLLLYWFLHNPDNPAIDSVKVARKRKRHHHRHHQPFPHVVHKAGIVL